MATKGLRLKCPILFHPFRWKATYIFVDWAVFPAHVSSRSYAVTYIHSVGNLSANAFEKNGKADAINVNTREFRLYKKCKSNTTARAIV